MEPPGEGPRLGPQSPEPCSPLSGHGSPPTGPPEPCACSLNTAVPARVRGSQARAPEPCSPLSGHGGPPPWPRAAASPEVTSDLCTRRVRASPADTTPWETGRPASTPLCPPPGPAPLHASAPARDSRGGWAPSCPVEVAEERPPTRSWAGRFRSGHQAGLAEGPSLCSWTAPAGHGRSKSGWGGESWSGGPSRRATWA